jgi:ATP phosphoribosyltransferase regulatory subunit
MAPWLLPENLADALPQEAARIETLRRECLDLFRSYGYELVIPPILEHIEALLIGSGRDLAGRTVQVVDLLSGRILGVRADMTPQAARIDAHLLNRNGVTRLCYAGSVVHARPAGLFASREPLQIGAELYGFGGIAADLEILELMVESLLRAGVPAPRIDLSHMGIVPALLAAYPQGLPRFGLEEEELYALLLAKDRPALARLREVDAALGGALFDLSGLYGPAAPGSNASEVLERARHSLPDLPAVQEALDALDQIVGAGVWHRYPGLQLSIDLADLRGHRYHTGVSFAAYVRERADAIARGGRYDNVGAVFGRRRPATGFSLELRELAGLGQPPRPLSAVLAPDSDDAALDAAIMRLRRAGEVVIRRMPGDDPSPSDLDCDRELVRSGDQWLIRPRERAH